jgi:hypothetical protein
MTATRPFKVMEKKLAAKRRHIRFPAAQVQRRPALQEVLANAQLDAAKGNHSPQHKKGKHHAQISRFVKRHHGGGA